MVVIGAGTGGLVAAAGSAGVGAKVALVEEWMMGGDCLNVGCVPSKAIIRCAHSVHEVVSSFWRPQSAPEQGGLCPQDLQSTVLFSPHAVYIGSV